ncbi:hypothetical protein D9615_007824 [Tricholomella constricta]|uniref:Cytochrome P450 n=1 Tax=Tricholomella constricta TaxID=117010 RepID=A0A8H5H4Q4_9AGAR|nr:hypothetical protein D9615_007824 [Tricholomella constricta]
MSYFFISLVGAALFLWVKITAKGHPPLPPGPPAEPIIGHMRKIQPEDQENQFYEWGKIYGKRRDDGVDKGASFYSIGKTFQKLRRMLQDYLNLKKSVRYQPIQTREARVLLQNLMSAEVERDNFIRRQNFVVNLFLTAIIMRLAYGHQATSDEDPYVHIIEGVSYGLSNAGSPGGTPVDYLPFLRHFPAWFPGAYYAGFARDNKIAVETMHQYPYEQAEGKAKPSFLSYHLEALDREGPDGPDAVLDIQGAAAVLFCAGAETRWCFIQKLKWYSAVPLGVPHRSLKDDVYRGMFIPQGSLIIANTRGMTLDERVYPNPQSFNPSRYLPKPEGNNEPHPIGPFGFGRRICPGRHLADASLWIAIASILATFNISKTIGEDVVASQVNHALFNVASALETNRRKT